MATMLFKVFTLTMKTVSKPLAGQFERYVMNHPYLRTKVITFAQWLHRMDVSITRGAEGKTGRAFVGDMSEERALQLASKVASEGFVYGTAVILLVLEMERKANEDREKKERAAAESARVEALHAGHRLAETELRKDQEEMAEILGRMDERLLMIEEQIMDMRRDQSRRRFLGIF